MHVTRAGALVVVLVLVSATGFAATPSSGESLSPVPFDETLSTGMTGVDVQQADSAGHVVPRAQVFYSQYEYVVGYYGMDALASSLDAAGRAEQFGRPMAIFVTDLGGTEPYLTEGGYVTVRNSVARGWVRAENAVFVVDSGARTPGGPATLPFGDRADAERFVDAHGGEVVTWSRVRARLAGSEADPVARLGERRAEQQQWANDSVAGARGLLDRPTSVVVGDDAPTLAAAVERAPPNSTVVVPAGAYEVNLTVEKPVTIAGSGEDTILYGGETGTVLTVHSPGVAVASLRIEGVGDTRIGQSEDTEAWDDRIRLVYGRGDAGIRLADAHGALVQNVTIETPANGVVALNSTGAVVRDSTIRGSDRPSDGFMGVLAMYSEMVVEDSQFVDGRDGVYTHYSNGIVVRDNTMSSLRYGVHEMYTSDALVANNTVADASVGLILMTRPAGNVLVDNRITGTDIGISTAGSASYAVGNVVSDAEVGISVGTDRSLYARNTVVDNAVGIRASTLLPTNTVARNDIVANDRAVAVGGRGTRNIWATDGTGNYWGTVPGLDRDGDDAVDRSYRPDDAVDRVAGRSAGGYAFARSPAVGTLRQFQQAIPGLRGAGVVDPAPRTEPVRPAVLERVRRGSEDNP